MASTDPLAAVQQHIDAFNKGDREAMSATFAAPRSILDGAVFTVALGKVAEGWRIAAWAWAKGNRA